MLTNPMPSCGTARQSHAAQTAPVLKPSINEGAGPSRPEVPLSRSTEGGTPSERSLKTGIQQYTAGTHTLTKENKVKKKKSQLKLDEH